MTDNKFDIIIPPQDIACEPGLQEKLASGDRAAFAWVYKNYCRKVYNYAMLITHSEAMSEDIVQDVFIKLWIKREKIRCVENFNGYLYTLYRNQVMDTLLREKRETSLGKYYSNEKVAAKADEKLLYRECELAISNHVKKLPPQRQMVFRLSRENGWKREKIATILKIAPNTVKGHLQKAIGFLRERLG